MNKIIEEKILKIKKSYNNDNYDNRRHTLLLANKFFQYLINFFELIKK